MRSTPVVRLALAALLALPLAACGGGGGGEDPGGGWPEFLTTPSAVLEVQNVNDSGPGSLRQAVLDAPPGAWIHFDPLLAAAEIQLLSPIELDKNVAIGGLSDGSQRFEIDGGNATGLFDVRPGVVAQITDFVLVNGNAMAGGAIYVESATLILLRCQVGGNVAAGAAGGGIYAWGSQLLVGDCGFMSNTALIGGAIHQVRGAARIERTSFFLNAAQGGDGGALGIVGSKVTIVNASFLSNMANAPMGVGGAISATSDGGGYPTDIAIYSSTIVGNQAGGAAGGIRIGTSGGVPTHLQLMRSIVAENNAPADPDFEAAFGATAAGLRNFIGIGDNASFWNGLDHNVVGDPVTPGDPMLGPIVSDVWGRWMRVPLAASPVTDAIPAGLSLNPEGGPLALDQRGNVRDPTLPTEMGAIER